MARHEACPATTDRARTPSGNRVSRCCTIPSSHSPAPTVLGSIPSPAKNVWNVGVGSVSIPLHVYGLMIALGVLAAVWISRRRWASWGNDPDLVIDLAYWGVPGGLIGARIYHVATDYNRLYVDNFSGMFKIWDGGLGIPGGILGGVLAGYVCARRQQGLGGRPARHGGAGPAARAGDRPPRQLLQPGAVRPSHARFPGRSRSTPPIGPCPTSGSPPSIRRSPTRRSGTSGWSACCWPSTATAVPTGRCRRWSWPSGTHCSLSAAGSTCFSSCNARRRSAPPREVGLFIVGAVVMAGAFRIASGLGANGLRRRADLFVLYIAGYFLGRLWVESLRIDTANTIAGLRLNEWTAILVGVAALLVLAWRGRVSEPRPIMAASGSVVGPPWDSEGIDRGPNDHTSDPQGSAAEAIEEAPWPVRLQTREAPRQNLDRPV